MGFRQGHTAVKVGSGKLASHNERCAAVGNSFHTGAVALLLKLGLEARFPGVRLPSLRDILASYRQPWKEILKSCLIGCRQNISAPPGMS